MADFSPPKRPRGEELKESDFDGWHIMYWPGGQMKVCFRPGGNFFCPEHPAAATWRIVDSEILIDWQDHGRIVLSVSDGRNLLGCCLHQDAEKRWRKTLYHGALGPLEKLLLGEGDGTQWSWKTPEGTVTADFRGDGKNQFVCYDKAGEPAAAGKWSIDKKGKTVIVDMGEEGKYELDVNVKKKSMDGYHIRPGVEDPDEDKDCREAEYVKNLVAPKAVDLDSAADGHGHSHGDGGHAAHGPPGHGESHDHGFGIVSLGNLKIAGETFMVDREGQLDKGFETTFGVERVGAGKAKGFKAWVQDGKGEGLCEPVEGDAHGDHAHFTVMPSSSNAETFSIKYGDQVSSVSVHSGAAPISGGIMSVLQDETGKTVGFIELKLHDDAGDLELWICSDGGMTQPLDFPASTVVTATFATHGDRSVTLAVRNQEKNEDEDGNATMRDGKTNYFIFPGESDQDPEWLVGEKFRSTTTLTFKVDDKAYIAPPFVLVPHM